MEKKLDPKAKPATTPANNEKKLPPPVQAPAAAAPVEKKTRRSASYLAVLQVEGKAEVVTAGRLPELVKIVSDAEAKGATFIAGMRGMPLARKARLTFGAIG